MNVEAVVLTLQEKLNQAEIRLEKADKFRHELRDKIESVNIEIGIMRNELKELREDLAEREKYQKEANEKIDKRQTGIGKMLALAATLLITLIGVLFAFLLQGGPGV